MSFELPASRQVLNNLSIVVVDDDADILYLAKLFLESAGGVVQDFLDPEDAQNALGAQTFDLLLTDFRMPSPLSGLELAQAARKRHPNIKVLIATGMDLDFCEEIVAQGFTVLEKPYNRDQLVEAIQNVFASPMSVHKALNE